jgi:SpoVK/Ycf46/Vps4 family AAA+-type ATPase
MMRSDLLLSLVEAANQGDQKLFIQSVEAMIAEERAKQHHILADRLEDSLNRYNNTSKTKSAPFAVERIDHRAQGLFIETVPRRSIDDLLLPDVAKNASMELIEEHRRADLLRSYGLEPRNRILLAGPPGNGKTSLAEAIAEGLMLPLIAVRQESIISSYLGETATRLQALFEFVSTRRCVLFFDEFDALSKERGDTHETGEIKRVVSSLLLQIDALPSYVVVIAATNHPELLDRAVWRRFQLRLSLPPPGPKQVREWFIRFEIKLGIPLGYTPTGLARRLDGISFAELEDFCQDIQRHYVLGLPDADMQAIVSERLKQWEARFTT